MRHTTGSSDTLYVACPCPGHVVDRISWLQACSACSRLHTIGLQLCRHGIWVLACPYTKYALIPQKTTITSNTFRQYPAFFSVSHRAYYWRLMMSHVSLIPIEREEKNTGWIESDYSDNSALLGPVRFHYSQSASVLWKVPYLFWHLPDGRRVMILLSVLVYTWYMVKRAPISCRQS
jgi:hypothetical protein